MSRRSERARRAREAAGGGAARGTPAEEAAGGVGRLGRVPGRRLAGLPVQLGLLAAVFAVTVGVAELAGAANLGVSAGIGQAAFTVVLLALLIRA